MRWIISLCLLLPALAAIIGVIAWAISAEVVMGAKRAATRKNNQISTLRLNQNFDNSDDFSINRINKRIGDSSKSLVSNSETALMREIVKEEQTNKILNDKMTPHNIVHNYDDRQKDDTFILDVDEDEGDEELVADNFPTTKKPISKTLDLEKIRKALMGTHVAEVIDRLVAQRKVLNPKEVNVPQIVVVAPVADHKKATTTSTSTTTAASSTSTKTTTTTTTTKPQIRRTTLRPMRARIQSMSLKLSENAISTMRPKKAKIKTISIKPKKSTTTTTPSTTTIGTTSTSKKPIAAKPRTRSRKTSLKASKTSTTTTTTSTTTSIPTTTLSPAQIEYLKSKIRQRELEFILDKVERLEKQQKHFLKQSTDHELLMESSFRDNIYKPRNNHAMPYRQTYKYDENPEYSYEYSPTHNYGSHSQSPERSYHGIATNSYYQNSNQMDNSGWQPSPPRDYVGLPQGPPQPPPPPPNPLPQQQPYPDMFASSSMHSSHINPQHQQMLGSHQEMSSNMGMQFNSEPQLQHQQIHTQDPPPPPPPPPQPQPQPQPQPIFIAKPVIQEQPNFAQKIKNSFKLGKLFNSILPIPKTGPKVPPLQPLQFESNEPNNRAISLNLGGDSHVPQESHAVPYQFEQRGHSAYAPETPGVQLNFGGGPMGGGGQLMTSPMGIFKTLLLPLMPKPRMNLNGKVVFGVVLENGVGFGKKPKILAQHFSTGHI